MLVVNRITWRLGRFAKLTHRDRAWSLLGTTEGVEFEPLFQSAGLSSADQIQDQTEIRTSSWLERRGRRSLPATV